MQNAQGKQKAKTVLILFMILSCPMANAQYGERHFKHDVDIKKITVDYLSRGHSGFEGFEPRGLSSLSATTTHGGDWGKIVVQYTSKAEWAEEISLDFYILTSRRVVLKGSITQVNIAKGKHLGAVFIHPTTLLRYGDIQKVAIGISHQGKVKAFEQWPTASKKSWWDEYPVKTQYIKKLQDTPFFLDEFDRYEDTK